MVNARRARRHNMPHRSGSIGQGWHRSGAIDAHWAAAPTDHEKRESLLAKPPGGVYQAGEPARKGARTRAGLPARCFGAGQGKG